MLRSSSSSDASSVIRRCVFKWHPLLHTSRAEDGVGGVRLEILNEPWHWRSSPAGKSRGMAGWLYIDLGPKIWDAIIWGGLRNYYKYFRQQMSTSRAIRTSVVDRLEWPVAFPNFNWGCLGGFGSYWVCYGWLEGLQLRHRVLLKISLGRSWSKHAW